MPNFLRDRVTKLYNVYNLLPKTYVYTDNFTFSPDETYALFCRGCMIYKICSESGKVTVFAGRCSGYKNGPIRKASFRNIQNITFSPNGKFLLVCDSGNDCIRKICLESEQVSLFSGIPKINFNRDIRSLTFTPDSRFILVCKTFSHCITKICTKSGQETIFVQFHKSDFPTDILFSQDGKFIFYSDVRNHCIRMICFKSSKVSTFAGVQDKNRFKNGPKEYANFNCPYKIAFSNDSIFVCDTKNNCIRKICVKSGEVTTFAGMVHIKKTRDRNGPKEQSLFKTPNSLTFSKDGKFLIICDLKNIKYIKIKN
jgi:WD40 repeat protein